MQAKVPVLAGVTVPASLHNHALWKQMEVYTHEGVCKRFVEEHGKSLEDANRVFLEMKRFLYLSIICQQPCSPSKIIDAMWHTFLVYTAHYRGFCQSFNGSFIDHSPSDKPEIEGYSRTREFAIAIFGEVDSNLWPDPASKLAGACMTAADCTCSNQGCSCNCSGNLGLDAELTLGDGHAVLMN